VDRFQVELRLQSRPALMVYLMTLLQDLHFISMKLSDLTRLGLWQTVDVVGDDYDDDDNDDDKCDEFFDVNENENHDVDLDDDDDDKDDDDNDEYMMN